MLGLAALTVLSLLWMALRVRRRGPFGRKSSAVLRVALPDRARPGRLVPRRADRAHDDARCRRSTDELLASLSVGLPVGLGVFLAWVDRGSAAPATRGSRRRRGRALGAWLGFNVTAAAFGFLAPFVAIVGATAGANLFLIALDVAWDRQTRR